MNILDRLRQGVATGSAEETRALAAELAIVLPPDVTLALHGDLGVGKTTFVQGLARGLGITAPVTSPTYSICQLLRAETGKQGGEILLAHLDAYRINSPAEIEALLLDDFLTSPYCLAVEWPDKVADWLPPDAWRLELGIAGDKRHTVRLRDDATAASKGR